MYFLCFRDEGELKMASPTSSLDSIPAANSIESLIESEFRSISPQSLPNSSPITVNGSSSSSNSSVNFNGLNGNFNTKCGLCHDTFTNPKVLPCFHTFCESCLERNQDHPEKLTCATCQQECILSSYGISGLLSDFSVNSVLGDIINEDANPKSSNPRCTGCRGSDFEAVARCVDCSNYLCPNCVMAHQFMHCFEGHRVMNFSELQLQNGGKEEIKSAVDKVVFCPRHKTDALKYFCRSCNVPICKECTMLDHPNGIHDYEHISDVGPKQVELMIQAVQEGKVKATDIRNMLKNLEHSSGRLSVQYHKAQNEINETFQFYRSMLEERKQELLKELDSVFSARQVALNVLNQKGQETVDKIYQTCDFVERLTKYASTAEVLMFKKLLDSKLLALASFNPDTSLTNAACDLEFVSNYQAIQVGVRNTFGYVRSASEVNVGPSKQPPIARPTNGTVHVNGSISSNGSSNGTPIAISGTGGIHNAINGVNGGLNGVMDRPYNGMGSSPSPTASPYESNVISKRFSSANSLGPFSSTLGDLNLNGINPYEKWSNGGELYQNGGSDHYSLSSGSHGDVMDLTSKLQLSTSIFPPKSQIKRQKMIYHCKFGEFGVMEGQFTEPSGVAVNAQNDIIVADTNNHRIQMFDKEGRFKFQFGECGKRDGQLLYPNRVAVVRTSGDIIVTERSPTHQIQIYNQYGQFVRKFGANILQHPRGVTVDNKGRIVVVECKVMRVIIFDQSGNVLQKFGCSKHLEFPNGVVVNDKQEIFISDNRAHCVKVFNYEGVFLRQIGGEGITNYPIGVGINAAGEILIADNHNNFNLTIFTQDGQLVSALESKVKHAQCFDVALMDDGSVVLASKDYRLYIYRYVQVPPIGL
ncbi:hypothetical protein FOCC_FOCC005196 [Frankliniella occidentalis]|nr:hypothetical protein FOCC_FOCC005196 [Frankliniella occidentalis]